MTTAPIPADRHRAQPAERADDRDATLRHGALTFRSGMATASQPRRVEVKVRRILHECHGISHPLRLPAILGSRFAVGPI